ncbi:hypothetical protein SAMN05444972_11129 [Marininema halotolerans]|uniref:Uncharacterized protein n=1 Tax=Marininema halotolerans TaxID=1155944 RepID=A0A1I6TSL6_9BACL|nr:hypothetical protein SAMN05444972_11129 [Marininema halotolerans]
MNIIGRKVITSIICSLVFLTLSILLHNDVQSSILFCINLVLPIYLIYGSGVSYFAEHYTNNHLLYTFFLCWIGALAFPPIVLILTGQLDIEFLYPYGHYSIYLIALIFSSSYWLIDRLLWVFPSRGTKELDC